MSGTGYSRDPSDVQVPLNVRRTARRGPMRAVPAPAGSGIGSPGAHDSPVTRRGDILSRFATLGSPEWRRGPTGPPAHPIGLAGPSPPGAASGRPPDTVEPACRPRPVGLVLLALSRRAAPARALPVRPRTAPRPYGRHAGGAGRSGDRGRLLPRLAPCRLARPDGDRGARDGGPRLHASCGRRSEERRSEGDVRQVEGACTGGRS